VHEIPLAYSGPLTLALIAVAGIFFDPRRLRRPNGGIVVAVATLALAALFMAFERADEASSLTTVVPACLLSLTAGIGRRLRRAAARFLASLSSGSRRRVVPSNRRAMPRLFRPR
jgi:hypothetical protein